jgi:hypothetical protein
VTAYTYRRVSSNFRTFWLLLSAVLSFYTNDAEEHVAAICISKLKMEVGCSFETLKIEAACFSETLVYNHNTTQSDNPKATPGITPPWKISNPTVIQ